MWYRLFSSPYFYTKYAVGSADAELKMIKIEITSARDLHVRIPTLVVVHELNQIQVLIPILFSPFLNIIVKTTATNLPYPGTRQTTITSSS